MRCGEKDLSQKECYPYPPPPWVSDDPDCSPLFERAVWFIPLDGLRAFGPDPEWDKMKYWVRVDDATGLWRIAGDIDPNIDPNCGSPCVVVKKPTHSKQYYNLEKDQPGTDECGLTNPPQNGSQFCVVVEVKHRKTKRVEMRYHDPGYRAPAGDEPPTNPGVADDFTCARHRSDNRATHPMQACRLATTTTPGFICLPGSACAGQCTEEAPCRTLTVDVVGEDRPQRFIFKFQVSSIGGDNYQIIARDPDHGCGLRDVGDESRTLTVWRKFGIYEDKMQAGDHTDDPDSSRVSGAFRDAFIETEFLAWDYTVHANWLRHLACFEGPLSGETYPESAGAAYFVHQELSSRYPPDHGLNPKDTVQIFGAHILAKERDTSGGSGYKDKAFGSACAGLVLLDYAHGFAALKTIENARDPTWMAPDDNLLVVCDNFGIVRETASVKTSCAGKSLSTSWGTPSAI